MFGDISAADHQLGYPPVVAEVFEGIDGVEGFQPRPAWRAEPELVLAARTVLTMRAMSVGPVDL